MISIPESLKQTLLVEDHGGPELYQFELLAATPVMLKAAALRAEHVVRTLVKYGLQM